MQLLGLAFEERKKNKNIREDGVNSPFPVLPSHWLEYRHGSELFYLGNEGNALEMAENKTEGPWCSVTF